MIPVKNLHILTEHLKAKSNPDKAIEYLETTRSIKGDLWAALWIKIHRDYPELAQKHPKLQEMPENPFMPTSIEHPLPPINESIDFFDFFKGKDNPITPMMWSMNP